MTLSFFRRHRKYFMVLMFAAVISMVLFGTWQYMMRSWSSWFGSEGGRQVVGTIDGRTVRAKELGEFYYGVRAAGQASQWWAQALEARAVTPEAKQRLYVYTLGMTAWPILAQTLKAEKPDTQTLLTWLALYDEARRNGFDTSEAQVRTRLEGLMQVGLTPELLGRVVEEVAGRQQSLLMAGLAKDMTLRAYVNWLGETTGGAVEQEMRRDFARLDERLKVRLAVLKADDVLGEVKDVPQDVLQQQFDKYKAFLPGKSPEGYGYRIADKVALEYLVADPAGFEAAAKVTDTDVRAYYDAQKDAEFLVEEEPKKEDDKKDAVADADEKKTAAPPEKKYRPFEEVRDEIRKTLVHRDGARLARERLYANVAEIRTMKKSPDLGIWADGKQVRHVVLPGLHTAEALAQLEGIGKARTEADSFPAYAVAAIELVGEKGRIGKGEISDVFLGADGEGYAFRLTAVEANREPANLDEVRDRVLADVRRAKAFDIVREKGKQLLEAASSKGAEAAAKDAGVNLVESDWFPREQVIPYGGRWLSLPPALPEVGTNRIVVAECFRMAADGRQRTLVTLAQQETVVVAELLDRKAAREAAFDRMRPLVAQRVSGKLAGEALQRLVDLGAIQRRMTVVAEMTDVVLPSRQGRDEGDED